LAQQLDKFYPELITAEYRVARRPRGRVLVDYNQNAWGRTLASLYSVRPTVGATVSAPVTWDEVEKGFEIQDSRSTTCRRGCASWEISGSRYWPREGGFRWSASYEPGA
jgi:DNA primase